MIGTSCKYPRQRAYYRRHRKKILAKARERNRKNYPQRVFRTYGLLPKDYEMLLRRSQGCCEICGQTNGVRKLCVDHDHVTHRVRGLLCSSCNTALSRTVCDPEWFRKAYEYLEREMIPTAKYDWGTV